MIISPEEAHDGLIMKGILDHYHESLESFDESRIVGIFCQGSQNYGLDYEGSDIDTKLIVLPSFEDIAFNKQPVSTTHIRVNSEHIDFKDLRLYLQTFRKQNINFLEILFTPYYIINPEYASEWNRLIAAREEIAHLSPYRAVKAMYGMAQEKYHAMQHSYPSQKEVIEEYGYSPKQLHHLARIEEFLTRYVAGESYENCLHSNHLGYLLEIKKGKFDLDKALDMANTTLERVVNIANKFCSTHKDEAKPEVIQLLDSVQYNIMEHAISLEFKYKGVYN